MKLSVKQLLFEAYRRSRMNGEPDKGKPLEQIWLGLGTEATYRPAIDAGLMKFHDGQTPPKRCMGWLVLTDKGVEKLREYEPEFEKRMEKMVKSGYWQTYEAHYELMGGITAT